MEYHEVKHSIIKSIMDASEATKVTLYFKLKLKYRLASQNIWFNQQCKKNSVFPKFIHLKTKSCTPAALAATITAKKKWLEGEIKHWFAIRDSLQTYIKILHSELTYFLHPIIFDTIDDQIYNQISGIIFKKFRVQKEKLKKLILSNTNVTVNKQNENKNNYHVFFPRVKNLSKIEFSQIELNMLGKGFKYNPTQNLNKHSIQDLAIDTEIALTKTKNSAVPKNVIAYTLKNWKNLNNNKNNELDILKIIKNKIMENKLTVTKADKGNTVVILDATEYTNKVESFISENQFGVLLKDPTNTFQSEVKNTIKRLDLLYTQQDHYKLIQMNPQPPIMYGLIKLHKDNIPIRPIVSFIKAPMYKINKDLNTKFLSITQFKAIHSVKNSIELVNKLKKHKLESNSKLISLDVTNLFTNIPTNSLLPLITKILEQYIEDHNKVKQFIEMFRLGLKQNYFQFNNKLYQQSQGLSMGSPLSPLLAEIYMDHFENTYLNSNQFKRELVFWYRYVDDILICWNGSHRQFEQFLTNINSIHQNMKFTAEVELEASINFLDLTISRIDRNFEFKIYRKPTHTDSTIDNFSTHPLSHKLAAYHSMIHRLFNIPMNKINFSLEINIIKQIASSNNFDRNIINKLINKKEARETLKYLYPIINDNSYSYVKLPYYGPISYKIRNEILKYNKQDNLKIVFYGVKNIGKMLINNKDKIDPLKMSGIYKLYCDNCPGTYIGQTGRNFGIRMNEHRRSYIKNNEQSTFAGHLIDTGHTSSFSPRIIKLQEKGFKLTLLEAHEISKEFKQNEWCLNEIKDIYCSPLVHIWK